MSGARIRAARGDIAVDIISPGEDVTVIRNGQECLEPVKWVGHSYVDLARHAHPEEAAPIRLRKNAIDDSQPVQDLAVSPEHCLVIDGLCVPAKLLVNGGSIVSECDHEPFTYYHLELEQHGILLAENTLTESYLDTGNRSSFDNSPQPRQLHPSFRVNAASTRWTTDACAPLAKVPQEVEPIWRRLAARSVEIGYPIPTVRMNDNAAIRLVADGQVIQPVSDRNSRYVFTIAANVRSVSLLSRFCIPSDKMIPGQRDTRRLGVRVNWIAIRSNDREVVLPADHPSMRDGWNGVERDGRTMWRWTDGAAILPWETITGSAVVTVCCSTAGQYPVYHDKTRLPA